MNPLPTTNVLTTMLFEDMFHMDANFLNYLREGHINDVIDEYCKNFNAEEAISFSSFLNMISQTYDFMDWVKISHQELYLAFPYKSVPGSKLPFTRENLHFFISKMIRKKEMIVGSTITGHTPTHPTTQKYFQTLLTINTKNNLQGKHDIKNFCKDFFIRDYPQYYQSNDFVDIYWFRLQRYFFIFNDLINNVPSKRKDRIEKMIILMETNSSVSIQEFFKIVYLLFAWFLPIGDKKERVGFNHKNISSFYINKENFSDYPEFIKVVDFLSADLDSLKAHTLTPRHITIDNDFFADIQVFFDYPIFKLNNSNYCVIDLKFLIESTCSGLVWHLGRKTKVSNFRDQYGYLVEEYFAFLLQKIFSRITISKEDVNQPDAYLETNDTIYIFEFTTEGYRVASLYNRSMDFIIEDIDKLLFNAFPGTRKKEKGKFFQLNKFIENFKEKGKRIVPILVTEKFVGDFDLLNSFDGFLDKGIKDNGLNNLIEYKPLITDLDTLENLWSSTTPSASEESFDDIIKEWSKTSKSNFHFNLNFFITFKLPERSNQECKDFLMQIFNHTKPKV